MKVSYSPFPVYLSVIALVSLAVPISFTSWVFSETLGWVTTRGREGGGGLEGGRSKSLCPTTSSGYSPASSIIAEPRPLWMSRYNATRLRIRGSRCSHPSTTSTALPPNNVNLNSHQNFPTWREQVKGAKKYQGRWQSERMFVKRLRWCRAAMECDKGAASADPSHSDLEPALWAER